MKMKKLTIGCALFGAILSGLWAEPGYRDPNQAYDRIPGTFITEHTPFLRPLAGGKLNILYLVKYVLSREVVEFSERLGQNYTVVMVAGKDSWDVGYDGYGGGTDCTGLVGPYAKEIVQKLCNERFDLKKKYDLIVIGDISWTTIPKKYRAMLLEHVKRGTGLLYTSPTALKRRARGQKLKQIEAPEEFKKLFTIDHNPEEVKGLYDSVPLALMGLVPCENEAELLKKHSKSDIIRSRYTQAPVQIPLTITTSSYGQGRIVAVDYHHFLCYNKPFYRANYFSGLIPNFIYDPVAHDYCYGLLAKCALWAAKRHGAELNITFDVPEAKNPPPRKYKHDAKHYWEKNMPLPAFARKDLSAAKIGLASGREGEFQYLIRSDYGEEMAAGKVNGPTASIPFPVLPDGNYIIDLTLVDKEGGKIDFVAKDFRVVSDNAVTGIKTDKVVHAAGDFVNGSVKFAHALAPGEKAEFIVVDTWKRLLLKRSIKLNKDRTGGEFSFNVTDPISQLWDISAAIYDKQGKIADKTCFITIPNWDFDKDYPYQIALFINPFLNARCNILFRSLQRFGVNAHLTEIYCLPAEAGENIARLNAYSHFYLAHLGERELMGPGFDFVKPHDGMHFGDKIKMLKAIADTGKPIDPKKFPKSTNYMSADFLNNQIETIIKPAGRFASTCFTICCENKLLGEVRSKECSGFSEGDTKMFREWCRKEYHNDLKALNAEWNTKFASWNEVKGIMMNEAIEKNQLPRWIDFRFFMRSGIFTELLVQYTRYIRAFVPKARTASGTFDNFDYTKLRNSVSSLFSVQPTGGDDFGSPMLELKQSFCGDSSPFFFLESNTLRLSETPQTPLGAQRYIWKYFFLGCKGQKIGMEQWDGLGGYNYLTADYSEPLPFFVPWNKELNMLQNGVSRLIEAAKPYRSKCAILWSPRNHYIQRLYPLLDNGFTGGPQANMMSINGAPDDALILMNSIRMRPTYIGPQDLENPEVMKKYNALILPYNVGMSKTEAEHIRKFVKAGGLVMASNEPGICDQHGKELNVPQLKDLFPVTNKTNLVRAGKGAALYLKSELNGYKGRVAKGNFAGADTVAVALSKYAGVRPPVEIIDVATGLPVRNVLAPMFFDGSAAYLGFVRAECKGAPKVQKVRINFKKKYFVKEIRTKKDYGRTDSLLLDADMTPRLFALLPVNPEKLTLEAPASVKRGEACRVSIRFAASGKIDFTQICNVRVYCNGKELPYFKKNVTVKNGVADFDIPISLSEPAGEYKVTAMDAATGLTAETMFNVPEK